MKLNKVMLAVSLVMGLSSFAHAAGDDTTPVKDQGHGKVTFHGTIIDAPCSIDADSLDQKIEFGQISTALLNNKGKTAAKNFEIHLLNCDVEAKKSVTVTFSGPAGTDPDSLGITGDGQGADIILMDKDGGQIKLGQPTKAEAVTTPEMNMTFSAYVQGFADAVTPGEFTGVTNFTLAYQ